GPEGEIVLPRPDALLQVRPLGPANVLLPLHDLEIHEAGRGLELPPAGQDEDEIPVEANPFRLLDVRRFLPVLGLQFHFIDPGIDPARVTGPQAGTRAQDQGHGHHTDAFLHGPPLRYEVTNARCRGPLWPLLVARVVGRQTFAGPLQRAAPWMIPVTPCR